MSSPAKGEGDGAPGGATSLFVHVSICGYVAPSGAPSRRLVGNRAALFVTSRERTPSTVSVSEPVAGGRIASGRVPTAVRERGVRDRARGRRTADAGAPQGPPVSAPEFEALNLRRSASRLSRSQDAS